MAQDFNPPSPELSRSRPDQDNPLGRPRSQTAQCKKRLQMYPVASQVQRLIQELLEEEVTAFLGRAKSALRSEEAGVALLASGQLLPCCHCSQPGDFEGRG